jgi:hypothetical protein
MQMPARDRRSSVPVGRLCKSGEQPAEVAGGVRFHPDRGRRRVVWFGCLPRCQSIEPAGPAVPGFRANRVSGRAAQNLHRHRMRSPGEGMWPQPARWIRKGTRRWAQDSRTRPRSSATPPATSAVPSAPSSRAEAHRSSSAGGAGSAAPRSGPRDGPVRRPIAADLDGRGCSPAHARRR